MKKIIINILVLLFLFGCAAHTNRDVPYEPPSDRLGEYLEENIPMSR